MIYLYLFGTCFHFIYVFMIIGNNLTTRILILRMLLLLDDAKHQRNQSHTPHKHQQCHQQLTVVSQPRGKVQTGPHRAQCRHTLEGNGQKRRLSSSSLKVTPTT